MAGYIAGFSNSLMMAQSVDPTSGISTNAMSQVVQMAFVMIFFLSNAHLVLFQLLAGSFHDLPIMAKMPDAGMFGATAAMATRVFEWGLKLSLPVLCVALLIDVSMGLASKLAPDFEILFLSLPIRLFTGIAVFGLVISLSGDLMQSMIQEMLSRVTMVFKLRGV